MEKGFCTRQETREENSTVKTMHGLNFFLALWVTAEGLSFHQGSLVRFFPAMKQ